MCLPSQCSHHPCVRSHNTKARSHADSSNQYSKTNMSFNPGIPRVFSVHFPHMNASELSVKPIISVNTDSVGDDNHITEGEFQVLKRRIETSSWDLLKEKGNTANQLATGVTCDSHNASS